MKRLVIAVIVALVVFGGTFAFAAGLGGITTGSVGDSAQVVASCDTDGVAANFTAPAWDGTGKRYAVSQLDVTGINAACIGDAIKVTVTDTSGAQIEEQTGTVVTDGAGGAQATVTFATATAEAVEGMEIVIAS